VPLIVHLRVPFMLMHFPQLIKLLMDCTVIKLQRATLLEWLVLASLAVLLGGSGVVLQPLVKVWV